METEPRPENGEEEAPRDEPQEEAPAEGGTERYGGDQDAEAPE